MYGRYDDLRIEIQPDARPDLRVVLLHMSGPLVNIGDRLEAAVTPLAASADVFPFASHIDRYAGVRTPHVHLEVMPA